jgi:hypothetical protein
MSAIVKNITKRGIGAAVRGGARGSRIAASTSTKAASNSAAHLRAFKNGAHTTSRNAAKAEERALRNTVKPVKEKPTPKVEEKPANQTINNNNTPGWKSTAVKTGILAGAGIAGGVIIHDRLHNDAVELGAGTKKLLEDMTSKVTGGVSDVTNSVVDHANSVKESLLETGEDIVQHVPGKAEIIDGAKSAASTLGDLTGNVAVIAGVGAAVFVAYEIYRFSR